MHKEFGGYMMDSGTPKYMELVLWIKEQLRLGKLQVGQKMYSENQLSEMFKMSRQTVRHAIEILEYEGVVCRIKGSGTYINDQRAMDEAAKNRNRVSVVTTYVDSYIFPRTIKGIENILSDNGYAMQISFTNNNRNREREILLDILEKDEIGGLICEPTKSGIPNPNCMLYKEILKKGIPIVFINSFYPELNIPHVSINDMMAGKDMTEYLLSKGHRKIGGVFKADDGQGHRRYQGFVTALNNAGIDCEDSNVIWIDTEDLKDLNLCKDKIKARLKECTAVACYNDEVALGVMDILMKANRRVPDDISIMGIDDSELAVIGDVEITSIQHPMEKLGEKTANNLIQLIKNRYFDANYEFNINIVERQSVKNINN